MRICSNCKTAHSSVQSRTLGVTVHSADQRESSTASHVDFCQTCWNFLEGDNLEGFNRRFTPIPDAFKA